MKYLILTVILLMSFSNGNIYSNIFHAKYHYKNMNDVGIAFYNRLAISQRIEEYTNRHIITKANKRGSIPSSLIDQIQSGVNYSNFRNDVISILNNHYTSEQMQSAIDSSIDLPYIEITSPKVKKELNDVVIRFWNDVDQSLNVILINNGF